MDPGQLFGLLIGVYFLLLSGFAAITAAQALEEDDRAGLGVRVFWSLTKTTLFLGVPALVGGLILLNSEAKGGGGIMSRETGLFVLFLFGALGLILLWVASITVGFVGAAIARNLRPAVGAVVLFLAVGGAPLLMAALLSHSAHQKKMERLHRGHR